jgi:cytochrome c-type biogenesis protein CcmE
MSAARQPPRPEASPHAARRRWRLYGVLVIVGGLALATTLVLTALGDNVSYFHTPSEIKAGTIAAARLQRGFRLGGLVEAGSVTRSADGMTLIFSVTDLQNNVTVHYRGITPDLFREQQGVVAEGMLDSNGVFIASRVLAKHDEKYMPPEVAKSLKQSPPPASSP